MAEVDINEVLEHVKYQLGDALVSKAISDAANRKLESELAQLRLQLAEPGDTLRDNGS